MVVRGLKGLGWAANKAVLDSNASPDIPDTIPGDPVPLSFGDAPFVFIGRQKAQLSVAGIGGQ